MVTVYIWDSRASALFMALSSGTISDIDLSDHGHTALLIGTKYMSFWPKGEKSIKKLVGGTESRFIKSYKKECSKKGMGRAADHKIVFYNLDEGKMLSYWAELESKQATYNLFSRNCSTTVLEALLKGSEGKWLATIPRFVAIVSKKGSYMEPLQVLGIVSDLKAVIG